ncbi:MAG: hypothetical protein A2474_04820 [Elusimicrobia bacterium RIFOXYC2_FULL_34_12]|nr:MAG: hypothetical protein A2474_04820 [Elusimicrobia bacterium RIFOXYC2_FULL_34_12]OGS39181.1 MAG: hypothetical protein A2551_05525 [Elusimicrobia bacterium RIFOXYD2_FULL_34_30]
MYAENGADGWTLKQCLDMAQSHSLELNIQKQKHLEAEQLLNQRRGEMLPDIRFRYSRFQRDTAGGEYASGGGDSKFTLSQPLFYGFRKTKAISQSKAEIKKEQALFNNTLRLLKADVSQAFFSVVQADVDIVNLKYILKLMQDRVKELNERFRLGKSRESEVLAVESQIATFKAQLEKTAGERANAVEILSRLVYMDSASLKVDDDTQDITDAGILEYYVDSVKDRADIESARQDKEIQSYELRIAKGSLLPTLNLEGSKYINRNNGNVDSEWDAYIYLDATLFQGGIIRSRIKEVSFRLQEMESKLDLIEQDAVSEVKKYYQALISSLNQVKAYRESYEKAEKSYQLQLRDYKLGLVNNLDVLAAMTTMSDAKRNLDRALVEAKIDKALLNAAANQ